MAKKNNKYDVTANYLLIAGGINVGLNTLFGADVINSLFSFVPFGVTIVNSAIGVSGVYKLINKFMD